MVTEGALEVSTFCLPSRGVDAMADGLRDAVSRSPIALLLLFAEPGVDFVDLAAALARAVKGVPTMACSSAGVITPDGLVENGVCGVALHASAFQASVAYIDDVDAFRVSEAAALVKDLRGRVPSEDPKETFAFLMIDGLSVREEGVSSALFHALDGIQMFGGSAADGFAFERCQVLVGDRFVSGGAAVALVHSRLPFSVFKAHHVVATDTRMVVTGATPERRVVTEIDGEAAAAAYARALGVPVSALTPELCAEHPVAVRLGGTLFIRSVARVSPDGSLTFLCAVEEGLVLTLTRSGDLAGSLETTLHELTLRLGPLQAVLACDCILRRVEADAHGDRAALNRIWSRHRVVGFHTYGEQYNGMHVNQTFTGVAFGERRRLGGR
jgi:hypothetical protein